MNQKYDILDPDSGALQILETCLADKIWNLLSREEGFAVLYLPLYFMSEEVEDIRAAVDQLLDEGRAYSTPAGRRIKPIYPN